MNFKKLDKRKCTIIIYLIFFVTMIFIIITLITSKGYKVIIKDLVLDTTISKYRQGFLYTGYYKPIIPEYLIASALPSTVISTKNLSFITFDDYLNYNYYIEEDDEEKDNNNLSETGLIKTVTIKPKSNDGYLKYGDTFLIDQSTKSPNIMEIMTEPLSLAFKPYNAGPQLLLYHTHNSEGFSLPNATTYSIGGSQRSFDNTKNIIGIGDSLEKALEQKNINVVHTITKNEMEQFNKSYSKSEQTAKSYLEKYKSINMTIDIHRDSITNDAGERYRTIAEIDEKNAAQIMIIVGTGSKELANEHWKENLKTAILLQQKIESEYKDLCRPILIRDARYNMQLTHGSLLIEVGTEANSFEESSYSMEIVSKALSELIKENVKE